jgi:Rad3-related DNA helicase
MSGNSIADFFPFPEFRDGQEDVLKRVSEAFDNDRNVLISAATGFGKSPVNICVCGWSANAFYTTPLKHLQDQLNNDFADRIAVIKGRSNYVCGIDNEATAADAVCRTHSNYKCIAREYNVHGLSCPYFNAKAAAQQAHTVCSNTSYMMMVPHDSDYGGFDPRELLVVDEAHGLDDWAVMYVSLSLYESDVGKIPEFKRFIDYVGWVETSILVLLDKHDVLQAQLDTTRETSKNRIVVGLREERDRIVSAIQKCNILVDDYKTHGEEWVWEDTDTNHGKAIQFKPITSGRFLQHMLWDRAERIVLSSATILYPELYLTDIGLDFNNTDVINIGSKFPVKNRPFYVDSCGKVNHITNDYLMPVMADRIKEIMDEHSGKNGIVHCHSYNNANLIHDALNECGATNVILQDRSRRNESLMEWIEDDTPSLFLSVNFTEGVDLKDDLCRYQVSVKVPFLYMMDSRVKARMQLKQYKCRKCGKEFRSMYNKCNDCGSVDNILQYDDGEIWYAMKTIENILQSYGRAVRSPTDYADYYMLDGSFAYLYYKNKNSLFPTDFKKALIWM